MTREVARPTRRSRAALRAIGAMFILGGLVRVFANESVFVIAGIGELWVDEAYFKYVYRVLGGFVVLTGLLLWAVASESVDRRTVLGKAKWGMVFVGMVMLGAGWSAGLPLLYYAVDFVFCFAVAFVLHGSRAN